MTDKPANYGSQSSKLWLRSLGYRTDLIFPGFDGEIVDRGHYLVVRTPHNQGYYWGNFLIFDRPPGPGDDKRWPALFAREFRDLPGVRHQAFGWDDPAGNLGMITPFEHLRFERIELAVLAAKAAELRRPAKTHGALDVRPVRGDGEWQAATQLAHLYAFTENERTEASWTFVQKEMARYRQMAEAGRGHWWGGWLGQQLVGGLGLFFEGGLGRFQEVGTHPNFRRQGVAGRLVYESSGVAFSGGRAERLVIVADEHYHAAPIYEGAGYRRVERQVGMLKRPANAA